MQDVLARGWDDRESVERPVRFLNKVGYRPYVTSVCAVEGCGLLADGQARTQLTTRGYAATVCTFQVLPVAGSPH